MADTMLEIEGGSESIGHEIIFSITLTLRRCDGGYWLISPFIVFAVDRLRQSINVAINMCLNCSFLDPFLQALRTLFFLLLSLFFFLLSDFSFP